MAIAVAIAEDRREAALSFDMRYVGQNFELSVAVDSAKLQPDALKQLFFAAHEMNYGYFNPDDAVEIVNYRLTARGRLDRPASYCRQIRAIENIGQARLGESYV